MESLIKCGQFVAYFVTSLSHSSNQNDKKLVKFNSIGTDIIHMYSCKLISVQKVQVLFWGTVSRIGQQLL